MRSTMENHRYKIKSNLNEYQFRPPKIKNKVFLPVLNPVLSICYSDLSNTDEGPNKNIMNTT